MIGPLVAALLLGGGSAPAPPQNPATGPNGISGMHGDSASSDTTPFAGPGAGPVVSTFVPLAAACPLVLTGAHGVPIAMCTSLLTRTPWVYLLDPASGAPMASLPIKGGSRGSPTAVRPPGHGGFTSTSGYPYPALPEGAGPSAPGSAQFAGGMTRVDVRRSRCEVRWTSPTRSSAVPRLSLGDGLLYTFARRPGILDQYDFAVLDPATGRTLRRENVGTSVPFDTLQTVGTITSRRVLYQGTLAGIIRVRPS